VVADLCRLGLEDTKQVGRVDKDDNYKDDNLGDKDIHLGMDGKPPIEKAASFYFFSGEECSSGFFLEKKAKKKTFFNVACPVKESNLTRRLNGKYKNLMEIISDLNVLIAAYNKLKSNPGNIMGMGLDSENTRRY
jgi:hypothetical protein